MTYEDLVNAFAQMYPTEFRHAQAQLRVAELEEELNDLRGDSGDSDSGS